MRGKFYAVRGDFPQSRQAEDLKTAAVCQNGTGIVDEFVQTAGSLNDLASGTEKEVIGVAEYDLCAQFFQFTGGNGVDAPPGAPGMKIGVWISPRRV